MRRIVRKGVTVAAAVALVATGTVAGGAAYVMTAGSSGSGGSAAPPRGADGASAGGPVTNVVPATGRPAPLNRVVPPDFLIVATRPVTAKRLSEIVHLKDVRDAITVDAGAVQLQGGRVNMFAVDPSRFRSWTPPGTAKDDALWTALARDQFVVSGEVQQQLGLRAGIQYPVLGHAELMLTMGGAGSLGLPGINVLVGRTAGRKIGLVQSIALLVNAPGADLNALDSSLHQVIGAQSQVINLHRQQSRLPQHGNARAGTYLALYQQAATRCPGLSWTVLAAIGQIESDHGRNAGPSSAGALGPMQFMPATWRSYGVDGDGDGKADIMDPYDAVPAAAKYLCAAGAARGAAGLSRAVFAYNHSQLYVNDVLALARAYAQHFS